MSVAGPHQERLSTDDKRIFGIGKRAYKDSYTIQTRHGIVDQKFLTSELMPLPDNIDLRFPDPLPSGKNSPFATLQGRKVEPQKFLCIAFVGRSKNGVRSGRVLVLKMKWILALLVIEAKATDPNTAPPPNPDTERNTRERQREVDWPSNNGTILFEDLVSYLPMF